MEPLGNILLCGFLEKKRIWELSYYVVSYFKCCDRPVRFFPLFHGGGCPAEHQRQFAGIGAESDFTGCDRRMEAHEKQYRAPHRGDPDSEYGSQYGRFRGGERCVHQSVW